VRVLCTDEDNDTVDVGGGSKTVLPVPVPIFLPAPMAMYNAPTPYPLPLPLPIPVPCFVPTTRNSIAAIMKQLKVCQCIFYMALLLWFFSILSSHF